ncbi:hypothetical protein TNCV_3431411 [Trichonephila clavipes]|nr:hypothetical protein TNCV_3431411 [Trichonephila clavipes]
MLRTACPDHQASIIIMVDFSDTEGQVWWVTGYAYSRFTFITGGLMISAAFSLDGRIHRYVFARGTVRYRNEVLEPYDVCLFTGAVGLDFRTKRWITALGT